MTAPNAIDAGELRAAAAGLEDVDEELEDLARRTVDLEGDVVLEAVRRRASRHVASGRMLSYVDATTSGSGSHREVKVHAGGRLAPLVIAGTAPHTIRARGRALELTRHGGGLVGFADSVRHPGTKPDPFVAEGLRDAGAELDDLAGRAADDLAAAVADHLGG